MAAPLYQLKAEFFKTLGHPARIKILELLAQREWSVAELLPEIGLEASHLSQQLGVLRRAGVVTSRKQGSSVIYAMSSPDMSQLMAVARRVLTDMLNDQADLLGHLQDEDPPSPAHGSGNRRRPTTDRTSPVSGDRSAVRPRIARGTR
jgi:ArsR family transcriptional regulator